MIYLLAIFEDGFIDAFLNNIFIGIVPLIAVLVVIIFIVKILNKKSKDQRKKFAQMLKDDNEANYSRAKDIDEDFFYKPNVDDLPIKEYDESSKLYMRQQKALEGIEKKMVKFHSEKTNTELKNIFGAVNLEYIIRYEENFAKCMQNYRLWAELLIENEDFESAEIILKESVRAGSEISHSYNMLANVYEHLGNKTALLQLKTTVENTRFPARTNVLQHIEFVLDKLERQSEETQ